MKIYKVVTRKIDIGPLRGVTVIGPGGTAARIRRKMKTVCVACGESFVEGDSLCCGFQFDAPNIILHEKCLDDQARSVVADRETTS